MARARLVAVECADLVMALRVPASEYAALERAAIDALPVVTRCVFCEWTHEGTRWRSREAAAAHRAGAHPDVKPSRRRNTRSLGSFRQRRLTDEDWADINVIRDRRNRQLGID